MSELTTIEDFAVKLADLLELRFKENGRNDYYAIGVHELCVAIKVLAEVKTSGVLPDPFDVLPDIPAPEPVVHYTDHHGHSVCSANVVLTLLNSTEDRRKVTCPECAHLKPVNNSTWPDNCPTCHAPWRTKSKTMGAKFNQPHRGTCQLGHHWYERSHVRRG